MLHVPFKIPGVVILVLLAGCVTGKEARQVAQETLAQLNTYESELDKKINAENHFYKKSVQALLQTFSSNIATPTMVSKEASDFADQSIAAPGDISKTQLENFLGNTLVKNKQLQESLSGTSRKYNEELLNSLTALKLQEDSLTKVRKGLEQLQSDQSAQDFLREWFNFAQATKTEFDKLAKTPKK
jgi:hypothetical protein